MKIKQKNINFKGKFSNMGKKKEIIKNLNYYCNRILP